MTLQTEIIEIHAKIADVFGRQPYIRPSLHVSPDSISVSWYLNNIDDTYDFRADTPEGALALAHEFLDNADPETDQIKTWLSQLAKVIDEAPPKIDTTPLSKFKEEQFKCLPAP